MHAVKKKLCLRAFGGIQELQSFAHQTIVRRHFTWSSGASLVRESRRTAQVTEGSGVSGGKLNDGGASSCVGGMDSRLRKPKLQSLVRLEGLQIGGLRRMGITNRLTDRAAEHGVRTPLPNGDGSPERIEEQRQDEFLRGSKRAVASKVQQVEEAVGLQGGRSFEAADAEARNELGMDSTSLVHETADEFINRSESHSTGSQRGTEVHYDGYLSDGIDEEVHRGLIADSEHPVGRVPVEYDPKFPSDDEADRLNSTDEALNKRQKQWEKGTSVESGAPKLVAEDYEKSEGVYGSYKPL